MKQTIVKLILIFLVSCSSYDDPEQIYQRGLDYFELGNYTAAIEAFEQVIKLEPDNAEVHYILGQSYFIFGKYSEAVERLQNANYIQPDNANILLSLCYAYSMIGRYQKSKETCYKVIQIDPEYKNREIFKFVALRNEFYTQKSDKEKFYWLIKNLERYNVAAGYEKLPLGSIGMICNIFYEQEKVNNKEKERVFQGKNDYFYFRVRAGIGPADYGAAYIFEPSLGNYTFRVYYHSISCREVYKMGNGWGGWGEFIITISPEYVFINEIPLVNRQYVNVLAKFSGLKVYEDQYSRPIEIPTFRVVAIQMHNADYNRQISQSVFLWGEIDEVLSDLVLINF